MALYKQNKPERAEVQLEAVRNEGEEVVGSGIPSGCGLYSIRSGGIAPDGRSTSGYYLATFRVAGCGGGANGGLG